MDSLRAYVVKYSDVMTVSMLVDLCNATGFDPSELINGSQEKKAKKVIEKVEEIRRITTQDVETKEHFKGKRFLTCEQVAEMCNVSKQLIWKWIREGKLTAVKFGREYRVREQDLKKCIEENLIQKA